MCVSPRNLLIQATLTMVVMPTWCGTTLIQIVKFRVLSNSVLVDGASVKMIVNASGGVQDTPYIPLSYKGRVKIEGRATLVIKNIKPGDDTEFKCEVWGSFSYSVESTVQLIVAGMYYRHNHL